MLVLLDTYRVTSQASLNDSTQRQSLGSSALRPLLAVSGQDRGSRYASNG